MDKAKLDRYFKEVKRDRIKWVVNPYICECGKEYKSFKRYTAHRRENRCQIPIKFIPL